ncbi:hypothetical protein [Halobacterium zhouii]|uniref:hypothetical protein n=1 Tax=Halobacterium zhouii TaxID=2902624 RepID=UPI001E4038F6|nr:hypothetical protein [Halobacterium zhouii]
MDVEVTLTGTLAARTGTHRARIGVADDATVADVVDTLATKFGSQVRAGVLEGSRLRSDIVAVRDAPNQESPSAGRHERLSAGSEVHAGDSVQFRITG